MNKVLVTGGTGLIGQTLCKLLTDKGYEVSIISRTKKALSKYPVFHKSELSWALKDVDYVVHLAGAGIADERWTKKRKFIILKSRTSIVKKIFTHISQEKNQLKAFISSSAVGFYGLDTTENIYTENDPPSNDFLGTTCKLWEEAADQFATLNIRTVKIRTGIVLSKTGGALEKMSKPIKLGFGAALGSGKQYIPWIHIDDICNMFLQAIENDSMQGAYNAVAPEHINNKDFTKAIAAQLNKKIWLPNVPAVLLKIILGSRAELVLKGSRVSCSRILYTGFQFKYTTVKSALQQLFSN
jgi:uncharacterized protein